MKRLIKKSIDCLPILIIVALGLIPVIWFYGRGNVLINGVDTNFPLDPIIWFTRRLYVWSSIPNGGTDFSSSTAGLFFHLIQVILYAVGLGLQKVQLLSLIFWFLLVLFSAYILASLLFRQNFLVRLLFTVLYAFNPYLFNTWENVKVANVSLVSAVPLALSVLILLKDGKISWPKAAFFTFLVGIIVSGAGINPSYLLAFVLLLLLYTVGEMLASSGKQAILALKRFGFVMLFISVANAFWVLPTINFIFRNITAAGSLDKLGFNNWVDSLSENTSILNVMRLQGAWDWYAVDDITKLPIYIPYSLNYFHNLPFIVFSFLLVGIAILAFVFRDKERLSLYIAFGFLLTVGVFLGTGTHLPTGHAFRWLINNVPFFTLFRSPWYIFTSLTILSIAGLVGLFFEKTYSEVKSSRSGLFRAVLALFVLIVIVGNFLYSYPLITGKIFRPSTPGSLYVHFPKYVFDAQKWLADRNGGRIVGYPDDELERFSWGYTGVESILSLLAGTETLFSPLNAPDAPTSNLVKEFYLRVKRGQVDSAEQIAAKLGVDLIFEKKDQQSLSPALPIAFKKFPVQSFGEWNFYALPRVPVPKIYSPDSVVFGYPENQGVKILPMLKTNELLLNPGDTVIAQTPVFSKKGGEIVLSENSQLKDITEFLSGPSKLAPRLRGRDMSRVKFTFNVGGGTYRPVLERYQLEDFGINLESGLVGEFDGQPVVWQVEKVTDSYVFFSPIQVSDGHHTLVLELVNRDLVENGEFVTTDFERTGEASYEVGSEGGDRYLTVLNRGEADAGAVFPIKRFDPLVSYLVEFKYRQIYGNNGVVLIGQSNRQTLVKTQVERLPNYPEWSIFNFYYEPVKTDSYSKVSLGAPSTEDPLGTKVLYSSLSVYKVFSNNFIFIKRQGEVFEVPKIEFIRASPVEYEGVVAGTGAPHLIVFSENYSSDWKVKLTDQDGTALNVSPLHFSGNLYANVWYIESAPSTYKFQVYYNPQSLFKLGGLVTGGTGLVLLVRLRKTRWGRRSIRP